MSVTFGTTTFAKMSTASTITVPAVPRLLERAESSAGEAVFDDDDDKLIEKLHEIPTFTDKYAERQWAKERMAGAFRVFAKLGFNDGAGGHISLRDPVKPDCFWISTFNPPVELPCRF